MLLDAWTELASLRWWVWGIIIVCSTTILIYAVLSLISSGSIIVTKLVRRARDISLKRSKVLLLVEERLVKAAQQELLSANTELSVIERQLGLELKEKHEKEVEGLKEKIKTLEEIICEAKKKVAASNEIIREANETKRSTTSADQYYFLPTASLTVTAIAKVIITKSSVDGTIQSAKLSELILENKIILEPDTTQLFTLQYKSSAFANDELRLNVNASGLIESVSATTEDRISDVIAGISNAPKRILSAQSLALARTEETVSLNATTQTVTYTNSFIILSEELQQDKFQRRWIINVDGTASDETTVDASFFCNLNPRKTNYAELNKECKGILTRPLYKLKLNVFVQDKKFQQQEALQYNVMVPDPSVLIEVPIERSAFVKKIHTPKFSNGLLIENFINKPSEAEGFLSIPINILKAIFSIPAQLFDFKITRIRQDTDLENASQNLQLARLRSKIDENGLRLQALTQRTDTEKKMDDSQNKILQKVDDLSNQRKLESTRSELQNNLTDLEDRRSQLEQLLANHNRNNLTDIDIQNINSIQQEIQLTQTNIDKLKIQLGVV